MTVGILLVKHGGSTSDVSEIGDDLRWIENEMKVSQIEGRMNLEA